MRRSTAFVAAIHCIFFLSLLISPQIAPRPKEKKKLMVHTVVPRPAPIAIQQKGSIKQVAAPKAPVSKPKPVPQKQAAAKPPAPLQKKQPAIANKTIAPTPLKKSHAPPPPRAQISDSLLKELEENIAKIDAPKSQNMAVKKNPTTPAPLKLQIDIPENGSAGSIEQDYTGSLIHTLHNGLSLPEFGNVKIQLTLREDGSVAKIVVLNTQSELNKKYLEAHLPKILFPPFAGAFGNVKERAFVLTFCNE